jgi:hypothetical protein
MTAQAPANDQPDPFAILWDYGGDGDGYTLSEESYATAAEALKAAMDRHVAAPFLVVKICNFSKE